MRNAKPPPSSPFRKRPSPPSGNSLRPRGRGFWEGRRHLRSPPLSRVDRRSHAPRAARQRPSGEAETSPSSFGQLRSSASAGGESAKKKKRKKKTRGWMPPLFRDGRRRGGGAETEGLPLSQARSAGRALMFHTWVAASPRCGNLLATLRSSTLQRN